MTHAEQLLYDALKRYVTKFDRESNHKDPLCPGCMKVLSPYGLPCVFHQATAALMEAERCLL